MSGPIKIRRLNGVVRGAGCEPAHKPPTQVRRLVPLLLDWFAAHARNLPWRQTLDPYAIWVSEIMLQQTQVKTVIPYWERWMRELPDVESLAKARPDRVLKLWEGLGYYTRARNLQKAAGQICERHQGRFPEAFDEVLALPGIGRYTAGAITSIAFNQPHPIVDGNVIRVLSRLFGIGEDPRESRVKEALWHLAARLVEQAARLDSAFRIPHSALKISGPCSALNQSMMELGATICTPRQPLCETCPVRRHCVAHRQGRVEELPFTGPRMVPTARRFVAFAIELRGRFLVCQRPAGVVNARLWEFPNVEVNGQLADAGELAQAALGTQVKDMHPLGTIKHTITRYRITVEAFRGRLDLPHSKAHRRREPLVISLARAADTLSPTGGEGRGEGARLMEGRRHPSDLPTALEPFVMPLTRPSATLSPSDGERDGVRARLMEKPSEDLRTLRWLPLAQLDQLAFTSAHRRLLKLLTRQAPPHKKRGQPSAA